MPLFLSNFEIRMIMEVLAPAPLGVGGWESFCSTISSIPLISMLQLRRFAEL